MGEDKAAAYALRDLSREMNLSDDSIAKIFEAVHEAEKEADAADDAEDNLKSASDKLTAKGVGRGQAAYDVHELARLATLVATTARLSSPKVTAARILQAPETIRGNQPAALAMNQLAHSIKLDQDSVASVFQAVRRGQQAGLSGQAQVKYVASEVSGIPRKPEDVQELARLAVLVEVGSANTTSPSKKEKVKK
jgi:hypothetical protein